MARIKTIIFAGFAVMAAGAGTHTAVRLPGAMDAATTASEKAAQEILAESEARQRQVEARFYGVTVEELDTLSIEQMEAIEYQREQEWIDSGRAEQERAERRLAYLERYYEVCGDDAPSPATGIYGGCNRMARGAADRVPATDPLSRMYDRQERIAAAAAEEARVTRQQVFGQVLLAEFSDLSYLGIR